MNIRRIVAVLVAAGIMALAPIACIGQSPEQTVEDQSASMDTEGWITPLPPSEINNEFCSAEVLWNNFNRDGNDVAAFYAANSLTSSNNQDWSRDREKIERWHSQNYEQRSRMSISELADRSYKYRKDAVAALDYCVSHLLKPPLFAEAGRQPVSDNWRWNPPAEDIESEACAAYIGIDPDDVAYNQVRVVAHVRLVGENKPRRFDWEPGKEPQRRVDHVLASHAYEHRHDLVNAFSDCVDSMSEPQKP